MNSSPIILSEMNFYKICFFTFICLAFRAECQENEQNNEKICQQCDVFRGNYKIENIKMYNDLDECVTCLLTINYDINFGK
jgi:hypothetical protein